MRSIAILLMAGLRPASMIRLSFVHLILFLLMGLRPEIILFGLNLLRPQEKNIEEGMVTGLSFLLTPPKGKARRSLANAWQLMKVNDDPRRR